MQDVDLARPPVNDRTRSLGIALLLCSLAASACASGRLLAAPRSADAGRGSASAQVFVLRVSQVTGAAITVPVEIDGTQVAELGTGDYLQFEVEPGPHVVVVGFEGREESQRVVASAGGRYFFEFHFEILSTEGHDFLRPLDANEGERAIASGKYSKLTE